MLKIAFIMLFVDFMYRTVAKITLFVNVAYKRCYFF